VTDCTNPPAPPGYHVFQGKVPPALTQWAIGLRNHIAAFPFGQTWTTDYDGETVLARCDCHEWTYRDGKLITGLHIKGITLYAPTTKASLTDAPPNTGDPLATPSPLIADALFNPPPVGTVSPWALVGIAAAVGGTAAVAWLLTRPRENPLQYGRSERTFRKNVAELRRSGYPRKQALAIAYRQQRTG
jgi:hypothetical protein